MQQKTIDLNWYPATKRDQAVWVCEKDASLKQVCTMYLDAPCIKNRLVETYYKNSHEQFTYKKDIYQKLYKENALRAEKSIPQRKRTPRLSKSFQPVTLSWTPEKYNPVFTSFISVWSVYWKALDLVSIAQLLTLEFCKYMEICSAASNGKARYYGKDVLSR